ncbi:hypothetical protein E2320_009532 [Naja naja]|nr:hypothetical protein E2320_009532 [Naja naja]
MTEKAEGDIMADLCPRRTGQKGSHCPNPNKLAGSGKPSILFPPAVQESVWPRCFPEFTVDRVREGLEMQAGTVSKHFIVPGVQLVTEVLTSLRSSSWEMGDSFSPEGTQDEGSSSSSEDTQWSPLHWSRSSMQLEMKRLQTFQLWPVSVPVSPADLAAAGFYFVGPADTVQCFCCGGLLYNWVADEDPMVEHKKFFPSCLYVQDKMVGNCQQMPWSEEHHDCVDGQFLGMLQSLNVEESPVGGQPEYPYMETEGDRLVTFGNWPSYSPVSPQLLARAGFFYTGQQDYVRCFYCDGALRNWEQGDDPWREHARWFPR